MSYMPCCGARLNMEGIHAPDCEDVQAAYEELLAEEHEWEARLTYPGDCRNIPGGY